MWFIFIIHVIVFFIICPLLVKCLSYCLVILFVCLIDCKQTLFLNECLCLCLCLCLCQCMCVCLCVYVYLCVCMSTCMCVCVSVSVSVSICLCFYMYVCVFVCLCVFLCICVCVSLCVFVLCMYLCVTNDDKRRNLLPQSSSISYGIVCRTVTTYCI